MNLMQCFINWYDGVVCPTGVSVSSNRWRACWLLSEEESSWSEDWSWRYQRDRPLSYWTMGSPRYAHIKICMVLVLCLSIIYCCWTYPAPHYGVVIKSPVNFQPCEFYAQDAQYSTWGIVLTIARRLVIYRLLVSA